MEIPINKSQAKNLVGKLFPLWTNLLPSKIRQKQLFGDLKKRQRIL